MYACIDQDKIAWITCDGRAIIVVTLISLSSVSNGAKLSKLAGFFGSAACGNDESALKVLSTHKKKRLSTVQDRFGP